MSNMFTAGDTVFLIHYKGHSKVFSKETVYSVSNKRGDIRLHGSDIKFDKFGTRKAKKTWQSAVWIEQITPGLLEEIRNQESEK